eukprot:743835-Lingulodinium_polyedra.AAC.1
MDSEAYITYRAPVVGKDKVVEEWKVIEKDPKASGHEWEGDVAKGALKVLVAQAKQRFRDTAQERTFAVEQACRAIKNLGEEKQDSL